jgi:hypothetical protein
MVAVVQRWSHPTDMNSKKSDVTNAYEGRNKVCLCTACHVHVFNYIQCEKDLLLSSVLYGTRVKARW